MKVWEVWGFEGLGWEVWPPEDYDAIYKSAQSPTLLHFPPFQPNQKNISKYYFVYAKPYNPINQPSKPYLRGYPKDTATPYSNHPSGSILSISNQGYWTNLHIRILGISGISGIQGLYIQGLLLHWGYYDTLSIPADFLILGYAS